MGYTTLGIPRDPGERREALRPRIAEAGVEALLVTALPNIRYLSGFTGSAAVLAVGREPPDLFFTDGRYRAQIAGELDPAVEAIVVRERALRGARERLSERGGGRLAFEREHLSVAAWEAFREAGFEMVGAGGWVEALRARKAPSEIDAIRRAARIADRAFEDVLDHIRPGVTERELAFELDRRLLAAGSERPAFETIVAAGPGSALPHARPSERRIASGEVVLLDFGALVDGYHSDISRTVACGPPPAALAEVYAVVVEAQRTAIEGLVPGLDGRAADALARDVIERAGYGEHFAHSLGHGIGLEVHEGPRLGRTSEDRLEESSVVTVEPGIYIDGLGGVRVEDDVLIGPRGSEVLTAAPRDTLIVL